MPDCDQIARNEIVLENGAVYSSLVKGSFEFDCGHCR
jgi:hypothetical protein